MLFLQENNIHRRRNLVMHINISFAKILLLHRFENIDRLKWKKWKILIGMVEMATFFTKKLYLSRLRRRYVFGYIVVRIVNGFFGSNVHTLPWPTLAEKENELNPFREFTKGRNTIRRNICQELSRKTFWKYIK